MVKYLLLFHEYQNDFRVQEKSVWNESKPFNVFFHQAKRIGQSVHLLFEPGDLGAGVRRPAPRLAIESTMNVY